MIWLQLLAMIIQETPEAIKLYQTIVGLSATPAESITKEQWADLEDQMAAVHSRVQKAAL